MFTKRFFTILGTIIISFLVAILQSYLHRFRTDYYVYVGTFIIYFVFGFYITQYKKSLLFNFLFTLPNLVIILFFGIILQFSILRIWELLPDILIILLGFLNGQLISINFKNKKVILICSIFCLLFYAFVANPLLRYHNTTISNKIISKEFKVENRIFFCDNEFSKQFSRNLKCKIILLDFGFIGCTPCKQKENSLMKLTNFFRADTNILIYKIINGRIDKKIDFDDYIKKQKSNKLNYLFDENGILCENYQINSYPYELILNNGKVEKISSGFSKDIELIYFNSTRSYLQTLKKLNEKN
jgi:hypothetical protein